MSKQPKQLAKNTKTHDDAPTKVEKDESSDQSVKKSAEKNDIAMQENRSLSVRLLHSLDNNHITNKNFESTFNLNFAVEFLKNSNDAGEKVMATQISEVVLFLKQSNETAILERGLDVGGKNNDKEKTFESNLDHAMAKYVNLSDSQKSAMKVKIRKVHDFYQVLKDKARSIIQVKTQNKDEREKLTKPNFIDESKDYLSKKAEGSKVTLAKLMRRFRLMSGGEKAIAVGALVFATYAAGKMLKWALFNDKELNGVGKTLKYLGIGTLGAIAANSLTKVVSGKSIAERGEDYLNVHKPDYWKKHFNTTEEKADALRDSLVYMGDKNFVDLANKYKEAKSKGEKSIKLEGVAKSDLSSEQVFTSLDLFFKKYGKPDDLIKQYSGKNPPLIWSQVVSLEMAIHGDVDVDENGLLDKIKYIWHDNLNWFFTGKGLNFIRPIYLKIKGISAVSDEQLKEWISNVFDKEIVKKKSDLDSYISRKLKPYDAHYKLAMKQTPDKNVHSIKAADGHTYVVVQIHMNNYINNAKATQSALVSSVEIANKVGVGGRMHFDKAVYVAESSNFVGFFRST